MVTNRLENCDGIVFPSQIFDGFRISSPICDGFRIPSPICDGFVTDYYKKNLSLNFKIIVL